MKTITLSEEAYERLKAWKESPADSFSCVVLKVVPRKGTLAQMSEEIRQLPPLTGAQAKVMEDTVAWGRDPRKHRKPWTS